MTMIGPEHRIPAGGIQQESRGAVDMQPSVAEPRDELIHTLADENRKLRDELEAMKRKVASGGGVESNESSFGYDLGTNTVTVRGFRARDMHIRHLQAVVADGDGIEKKLQESVGLSGFSGPDSSTLTALISTAHLDVRKFSIEVSSRDATQVVLAGRKADLEKEGIRDLAVSFEPGNCMVVRGTLKKLITIPFTLIGSLSVTDDHRIKYTITDMSAGIVPLPDLLQPLVLSLAGGSLHDQSIEVSGDNVLVNTAAMLPDNIRVKPVGISTKDGFVVVEG